MVKYNFSAGFLEKRKEVVTFCVYKTIWLLLVFLKGGCKVRNSSFSNNLHCTVRSTVKVNTTMFGYHFAGALIASADSMPMHRPGVWEGANATIHMPSALQSWVILHLSERKKPSALYIQVFSLTVHGLHCTRRAKHQGGSSFAIVVCTGSAPLDRGTHWHHWL